MKPDFFLVLYTVYIKTFYTVNGQFVLVNDDRFRLSMISWDYYTLPSSCHRENNTFNPGLSAADMML